MVGNSGRSVRDTCEKKEGAADKATLFAEYTITLDRPLNRSQHVMVKQNKAPPLSLCDSSVHLSLSL